MSETDLIIVLVGISQLAVGIYLGWLAWGRTR
jgi:hypothetical protein